MAKKLYVGNLPYDYTNENLTELFSEAGVVETATIIMDRDLGRSKGFGFVEMKTEEEAKNAITKFNGYVLNDRSLTVNEARPQEKRTNNAGGGSYNRKSW